MTLSHHCSYTSLSPDRFTKALPYKTPPVGEVKGLYEEQRQEGCRIVSTSRPFPIKGSDEDDSAQPPHRESANYYKEGVLE